MTRSGVIFYPFHLCHERTLQWLLERYQQVHFRDYMAIQVSPFCGTTAFPERMGDSFPDLLASKRLVQGYNVSGPLNPDTCIAVDRDLTDSVWRGLFHSALVENRRFQRGLFDGTDITGRHKDGHAEQTLMVRLKDVSFETTPFTVAGIRQLSQRRLIGREADLFDYGLALLKTSASLVYTIQLATAEQLAVATDSRAHFTLLTRLIERMSFTIENGLVEQGMSQPLHSGLLEPPPIPAPSTPQTIQFRMSLKTLCQQDSNLSLCHFLGGIGSVFKDNSLLVDIPLPLRNT